MSDFFNSGWSLFVAAATIVSLIACLVLLAIAYEEGIGVAKDPKAAMSPERRQWEIQLAQMYGVLGHTSQSLGKKAEARDAFVKGGEHWERLAGIMPGDEVVQQGQSWTKERLAKLK